MVKTKKGKLSMGAKDLTNKLRDNQTTKLTGRETERQREVCNIAQNNSLYKGSRKKIFF